MSAKKSKPLSEKGADTAQEMYALVGAALSWWESSEDIILGLFRAICGAVEPVGMEAFIRAPRNVRYSMLRAAMSAYSHLLEPGETEKVDASLKALDKLASLRNEIAHGHVSEVNYSIGAATTASGNYLLPSFHEQGFHERNFRFHHTPETIVQFVTDLRKWRGDIMDVHGAVFNRVGSRTNFGMNSHSFVGIAQRISRYELHGYEAVDQMKALLVHVDRDGAFSQSDKLA